MFAKESEMTDVAARWLQASGLVVKKEVVSPWGICDLVGAALNDERVSHRLKLKQTRSVSSIRRASLLLRIPDSDTGESATMDQLIESHNNSSLASDLTRLLIDKFVIETATGFQRVNGWCPLHNRLVAVELKLFRIDEVLRQAVKNFGFADESFVGLPLPLAQKVFDGRHKWQKYFDSGIGLLGLTPSACNLLLESRRTKNSADPVIQFHSIEKFWQLRSRHSDSTSSKPQQ